MDGWIKNKKQITRTQRKNAFTFCVKSKQHKSFQLACRNGSKLYNDVTAEHNQFSANGH